MCIRDRSNAFAIAKKLGLPDAVIDSAKATLSGESSRFETVVDVLEDKRTQYENELQQVEEDRKAAQRLKEESAERRRKAEEQAERILKEARRQAEKIVDDIRSEAMLLKEEMDDIRRQGRQQQGDAAARARAVSYTHLDVYKRQEYTCEKEVGQEQKISLS